MKVAVAVEQLSGDVGRSSGGQGRDGLLQGQADEADPVGRGLTGRVDQLGGIELGDSLRSAVEGRGDEDEAAAGGESMLEHEVGHDVLAPELFETRAAERGTQRIDEEAGGSSGFVVAGPVGGGRTDHVFGVLDLDRDDGRLAVGRDTVDEGVESGAIAEVVVCEPTGRMLKAQSGHLMDEAGQELLPDAGGQREVQGQRREEVEGQGLRGKEVAPEALFIPDRARLAEDERFAGVGSNGGREEGRPGLSGIATKAPASGDPVRLALGAGLKVRAGGEVLIGAPQGREEAGRSLRRPRRL